MKIGHFGEKTDFYQKRKPVLEASVCAFMAIKSFEKLSQKYSVS